MILLQMHDTKMGVLKYFEESRCVMGTCHDNRGKGVPSYDGRNS